MSEQPPPNNQSVADAAGIERLSHELAELREYILGLQQHTHAQLMGMQQHMHVLETQLNTAQPSRSTGLNATEPPRSREDGPSNQQRSTSPPSQTNGANEATDQEGRNTTHFTFINGQPQAPSQMNGANEATDQDGRNVTHPTIVNGVFGSLPAHVFGNADPNEPRPAGAPPSWWEFMLPMPEEKKGV